MKYSNRLKSILHASGWSQEELAQHLHVSFPTLNSWVNERSQPRKKALETIEALYFEIVGLDTIDQTELEQKKQAATILKTTVRSIVNDEAVLNALALHLTYHTDMIEGSTMTLADTEAVLFEHGVLTNRTQIEQAEARNHQAALLWLLDQMQSKHFAINENIVGGLHLRLMNGITEDAGEYRRHGVRIARAHVVVANHLKVPALMNQLLRKMKLGQKDPIAQLANTHADFEKIHPFSDGNGRVGRLIMLAQALQAGIVPPLILKERKSAYYKYLELAQMKDEIEPLEMFIAESIITASELLRDT